MSYDDTITGLSPTFRWQLDGDLTEDIQSLNGSSSGTVTYATGIIPEDAGQSADFTFSVADDVTIPNDPEINTGSGYTFTKRSISFWITLNSSFDASNSHVMMWKQGGNTNAWALYYYVSTAEMVSTIAESSSATGHAASRIVVDTLYHIGSVVDLTLGSNHIKLYVNGELVDQADSTAAPDLAAHSGSVNLGFSNAFRDHLGTNNSTGGMEGNQQDVVYWSEVALTDEQMASIYSAGVGGTKSSNLTLLGVS